MTDTYHFGKCCDFFVHQKSINLRFFILDCCTLHPGVWSYRWIRNKIVDDFGPWCMMWQTTVILRRYLSNLWNENNGDEKYCNLSLYVCWCSVILSCQKYTWQPWAWYIWEIMMLIVIANVESNPIERSIIWVGLETFIEHIMLGYEMTCHRMETHCHQWSAN